MSFQAFQLLSFQLCLSVWHHLVMMEQYTSVLYASLLVVSDKFLSERAWIKYVSINPVKSVLRNYKKIGSP